MRTDQMTGDVIEMYEHNDISLGKNKQFKLHYRQKSTQSYYRYWKRHKNEGLNAL